MKIAALLLSFLISTPALADHVECKGETRASVRAVLAGEPVQHVVAELSGEASQALVKALGGPETSDFNIIIADLPQPDVLVVLVFHGECLVVHAPVPLAVINRILKPAGYGI